MMNEKETLRNFEEDSGFKFIEVEEYTSIQNEIDNAANKTQVAGEHLATQLEEEMKTTEETNAYNKLKPELLASLKIDKFCPECKWSKDATCQQNVDTLAGDSRFKYQAILATMTNDLCQIYVDTYPRNEQQKAQKVIEDELLINWDHNEKDLCLDCEWDPTMTCSQRITHINQTYGISLRRAGAMCLFEIPSCRNSYHAEEAKRLAVETKKETERLAEENKRLAEETKREMERLVEETQRETKRLAEETQRESERLPEETQRLEHFCEACVWGGQGEEKTTCGQRVEFLKETKGFAEREAKLLVVEWSSCSV